MIHVTMVNYKHGINFKTSIAQLPVCRASHRHPRVQYFGQFSHESAMVNLVAGDEIQPLHFGIA